MNRYSTAHQIVLILACAFLSGLCAPAASRAAAASDGFVTVHPEETEELLGNPGMGWETFHRTRDHDRNLPDWIPSTVHYARWGWGTLEPAPGRIDTAFLDKTLEETHAAGQRLAFRVMCCSTTPGRPYHPDWLPSVGGKVLTVDYGGRDGFAVPDLDDPVVLQRHLDFIKRLGDRYDGHPDIDHVDLGTVGWWGEWHMSSSKAGRMPTLENREKIIDAYFNAFRKTRLLMLVGDSDCLRYAAAKGAGWRADCLGDLGGFSKTWCHMRIAYPQLVKSAGVDDAWKTAPIAWETCWDMRRWVQEGWSLRYIFNYALAVHGSYINNKSAPLPEGDNVRSEIERFLRRLGYRLVLQKMKFPAQAEPGKPLAIETTWQNVGSAPCYEPYRVAYRLTDRQGRATVLTGSIAVDKWMPGSVETFTKEFLEQPPDLPPGEPVEVTDRVELPRDLPPGRYHLAVGIVGEAATEPVVKLAIKGRAEDGWYPMADLTVVK